MSVRMLLDFARSTKLLIVAMAAVVLLPLLAPGYIFALDGFIAQHSTPTLSGNNYVLFLVLRLLGVLFSEAIVQRLLLGVVLLLAGYGAYILIRKLLPRDAAYDSERAVTQYFASSLYMCNPFVYERFVSGQWFVLLGYALLPWFVLSAISFFERPSLRVAATLTGLTVLLSIASAHLLGMALLVFCIFAAVEAHRHREHKAWFGVVGKYALLGLAAFVALSSYWLVPLLLGHGHTADTANGFTASDETAFATTASGLGVAGNVLALQGFWAESHNLFWLPNDLFVWWWIPIVLLWVLVGLGVWVAWQRQRAYLAAFVTIGTVGFVLAVGSAGTIFAPFNRWLFAHAPLFAGYRDTQKFAALLVLAYVYFASLGVYWLASRLRVKWKGCSWFMLALPVLCAPLLVWGAAGQVHVGHYPPGWYQAEAYLCSHDADDSKVLFLPWHLYMPFDFAGGSVIANPASKFFTVPIVSSDNPELASAHGYSGDPTVRAVESNVLMSPRHPSTSLGQRLSALHIHYVLIAKEYDYSSYAQLAQNPDLRLVLRNQTVRLYEITRPD